MKIKTISFTYERKWNTGDYESAHIGMSVWADLDEGEAADPRKVVQCAKDLEEFVKGQVRDQSLPVLANRKAKVTEFMSGLPVSGGNGKEAA